MRLYAHLGVSCCGYRADLAFEIAQRPRCIQRNAARIAHDAATVIAYALSLDRQVFACGQRPRSVDNPIFGIDGERLGATNRAAGVIQTLSIKLQISLYIERA